MVSAELMEAQRQGNSRIGELLARDLAAVWSGLDLGDRDGVRAAVLEAAPVLVDDYGQVSASLSADFFEDAVGARPVVADARNDERVGESARWAIGPLWDDNPDQALAQLTAALTRLALRYGRETIHVSSMNTRGVSYAWVPGDLCPYCVERGSRGAAFGSSQTLEGLRFHDGCNCELVPVRSEADFPPGYSPAELSALLREMNAQGQA